jgi:hypothetical protein
VTLDAQEKHGKLQGAPGSYFSGKSTYSAPEGSTSGGPTPCRGGKEYVTHSSTGSFTRGLKADFITGTDPVLHGQGSATRTIVRNA